VKIFLDWKWSGYELKPTEDDELKKLCAAPGDDNKPLRNFAEA
jgi:hypothetical protein